MRKSRLECSTTTRGSGLLTSMIMGSSPKRRVVMRGSGMLTFMIMGGGLEQSTIVGGSRLLASMIASADLEDLRGARLWEGVGSSPLQSWMGVAARWHLYMPH